jgi:nucleotide-binding universal stress UspA family protein
MMILLCYDGSADSQAAIDRAARLMPGSEATVLVIWEGILDMMTRNGSLGMGLGLAGASGDEAEVDAATEKVAFDNATEGAQRATDAGLVAQPRIARRHGAIAAAILTVAAEVDADVVVLGTRGLGGVKSLMLGSVSHAVLHHADRAVLVVPSSDVAKQRRGWARRADSTAGVT